jgi:hypothetical protein
MGLVDGYRRVVQRSGLVKAAEAGQETRFGA